MVTKLKNSNGDKTQKLKFCQKTNLKLGQNSKTQTVTKLKFRQNSKILTVTKLEHSNCDEVKNSNFDKT